MIVGVNSMKRKTSQGRKKIEIKKIEEVNNRQVTFSKRRAGLFKKASELCILTGAQVSILVHSPGGRFFAFGHPTADALINRFIDTNNASTSEGSISQKAGPLVEEFNQHYVEVSNELEAEKKRKEAIEESKNMSGRGLQWYEETVDGLEIEELQQYLLALVELKRKVLVRADELMMIQKAPTLLDMSQAAYPNDASVGFNFAYTSHYMM